MARPRLTFLLCLTAALSLLAGGCANNAQSGALIGGAGGAGLGALIGSTSHSRAGEGALIGGAAGAIGGYIIGNEMDKAEQRRHQREVIHPRYRYADAPREYGPPYQERENDHYEYER